MAEEPQNAEPALAEVAKSFDASVRAMHLAFNLALPALAEAHSERLGFIRRYLEGKGDTEKDAEEKLLYLTHAQYLTGFSREIQAFLGGGVELIARGFFITTFTILDTLFAGLHKQALLLPTAAHSVKERQVTFKDLVESGSIEEVRNRVIDEAIDDFLRGSYSEQLRLLGVATGQSIDLEAVPWPQFTEAAQRRHLAVHTDQKVTRQYLQECEKAHYNFGNDRPEVGAALPLPPDYLRQSLAVVEEIGLKAIAFFGPIIGPLEVERLNEWLAEAVYFYVAEGRYPAAVSLGTMLIHPRRTLPMPLRLRLTVNVAQAHKWMGNEDECQRLIGQDWSAYDPDFRCAHAVLRDDIDQVIDYVKKGPKDDRTFEGLVFWPLYQKMRESEVFRAAVAEHFGREIPKTMQSTEMIEGMMSAGLVNLEVPKHLKSPHGPIDGPDGVAPNGAN
jgi:hypothetical protein